MRLRREILAAVLAMVASLAIGQDWTPTSTPSLEWTCLASSADGGKLFAGKPGGIYVSTNFGSTWTPANSPTPNTWYAVGYAGLGVALGTYLLDRYYFSADESLSLEYRDGTPMLAMKLKY